MQKGIGPEIIITEEHKAKICLEMIGKFMNLWREELDCLGKPNMRTDDYKLIQFQWWVGKQIKYNDKS